MNATTDKNTTKLDERIARMLRPRPKIDPQKIGIAAAKLANPEDTKKILGDIGFTGDAFPREFDWAPISAGNCALTSAKVFLYPDGNFDFSGLLTSSHPGHDAWGILSLDFFQANGVVLFHTGDFWSDTIHVATGGQPFVFRSGYPSVFFNTISWINMQSHC